MPARRGLRAEAIERRRRYLAERDALLDAQLESGEVVVARGGDHPLVTDRRIMTAHRPLRVSGRDAWTVSSLAFAEILRWTPGRLHDHRPLLRLEHPPRARMEHVPSHRFLWFEWGNAEGPVIHTTTTFGFGRATDPVLIAIREGLVRAGVPRGEPFVVRPAGTREERTRESHSGYWRPVSKRRLALGRLCFRRFGFRSWWRRGRAERVRTWRRPRRTA